MRKVIDLFGANLRNLRMSKPVPLKQKREFAAMVKRWRDRRGLSQSEAARILEVPLKTLQNWEIARSRPQGFALNVALRMINKA